MTPITLTPKERALIEYIRALKFGTLKVIIMDGQPDRSEEAIRSVKF